MTYHCFSERRQEAKSEHQCVWCCWPILRGSKYIREHSVYDGHFQNFAWHEQCRADSRDGVAAGEEFEFTSGNEMPFLALYQLEATDLAAGGA